MYKNITCVVGCNVVTLQIVERTSAGSTGVHVHIEWLMIQTTFIDRFIIVHCHLNNSHIKSEREGERERECEFSIFHVEIGRAFKNHILILNDEM